MKTTALIVSKSTPQQAELMRTINHERSGALSFCKTSDNRSFPSRAHFTNTIKKYISATVILVSLCTRIGLGQTWEPWLHVYGRYSTGIMANTDLLVDEHPSYYTVGLTTELLINDLVGLNYNLDLQMRSDDIRHVHYTIGTGLSLLMLSADLENYMNQDPDEDVDYVGWGCLALITLILPDGISLHYSPSEVWEVSPYFNFLGLDLVDELDTDISSVKYAYSFGVRGTRIIMDCITLSAYTELRGALFYSWGVGGGMAIGILL